MTTWEVDVHIVVLTADRLFYERLVHDLAVDNNGVAISTKSDLGGHLEPTQRKPNTTLHDFPKLLIQLGSSISRHLESARGRYAEVIKDRTNKAAIPKQCLRRQLVDAEWMPQLHIGDGLVQREIGRKEGNKNVASWPVLNLYNICALVAACGVSYFQYPHPPSSSMTFSPNTLTLITPPARSTRRVKISRMAFDRALTSMAHIPRVIGGRASAVTRGNSECESLDEGVVDLFVSLEWDRGVVEDGSDNLNKDMRVPVQGADCWGTPLPSPGSLAQERLR